VVYTSSI
jgi:hypothetical protein